jgi:hypothetical protein
MVFTNKYISLVRIKSYRFLKMPSKSENQRKMIFAKRNQYKTKANAPEEWKWVFEKGWETIEENTYTKNQIKDILMNRYKYKSPEYTPDYAMWIWDVNDFELELNENKEVKMKERYKQFFNEAKTVDGFLSPEPGDLPEAGADMLANIYAARRKAGDDKEKAAKIAWSQVRQKYSKKD